MTPFKAPTSVTSIASIASIASVAIVAVSAAAFGFEGDEVAMKPKEIIKKYDLDGDRKLSQDEFRQFKGNRYLFRQIDANRDGFVTVMELEARVVAGKLDESSLVYLVSLDDRTPLYDLVDFDLNGDGRINPKEYRRYVFELADQNDDEAIDRLEAEYLARAQPFASEFSNDAERVLARYDRSRDERVSFAEFKPDLKFFKTFDRDGDGQIAADELTYRGEKGLAAFANMDVDALIERYDRNKDGVLRIAELPGGQGLAGMLDRDQDGEITRDELDRVLKYAQREQFATIPASFFDRFDLNDDRKVTRDEFAGDATTFARIDLNGDGVITKSDVKPIRP